MRSSTRCPRSRKSPSAWRGSKSSSRTRAARWRASNNGWIAMILEGYAALFGVRDLMGDVIRAGAFRGTLARRAGPLPMLVQHDRRVAAGFWTDVREDARGLFVRGEVRDDLPGAARAKRLIESGIDGLSIG